MRRLTVPAGVTGVVRGPVTGAEIPVVDGVVEVESAEDADVMIAHLYFTAADSAPER